LPILDDTSESPADRRLDLEAQFGATEHVMFRHTYLGVGEPPTPRKNKVIRGKEALLKAGGLERRRRIFWRGAA
jgi:hypothetical protein